MARLSLPLAVTCHMHMSHHARQPLSIARVEHRPRWNHTGFPVYLGVKPGFGFTI